MRYGAVLRNSGPHARRNVRTIAEVAADHGYDSVWASEHVVAPTEVADRYGVEWIDPFVALASVAAITPDLGLGFSCLLVPFRPVVPTAKALASLRAMTDGEVVCAVGSGWSRAEHDAMGTNFADRGRAVDAFVDGVRAAWQRADLHPTGPVTLIAAGNSPTVLRRAAGLDGWHPIARAPKEVAADLATLPEGARCVVRARLGIGHERNGRPLFGDPASVAVDVAGYEAAGVTDLVFDYTGVDLEEATVQLTRFATEVAS